jgi:YD repeat-containing protein
MSATSRGRRVLQGVVAFAMCFQSITAGPALALAPSEQALAPAQADGPKLLSKPVQQGEPVQQAAPTQQPETPQQAKIAEQAIHPPFAPVPVLPPAPPPQADVRVETPDVDPKASAMPVALLIESRRVRAGKKLKLSLVSRTEGDLSGYTIVARLPEGVTFDEKSSKLATYDPAARELTWRGLDAQGKARGKDALDDFTVTVGNVAGAYDIALSANGGGLVETATETLTVQIGAERAHAPINKGQAAKIALSNRVSIEFPEGALQSDSTLSSVTFDGAYDKSRRARGKIATPEIAFEIGPDMKFDKPVTASIDLNGLLTPEMHAAGLRPVLHYLRPVSGTAENPVFQAEDVPSRYDSGSGLLIAQLTHFSSYAVGFQVQQGQPEPWRLSPNLGTVGAFRGAVNWSQPIAAPKLPDGLGPNLAIGYSSASAEGSADVNRGDDYRMGGGWYLDMPRIERGVKLTKQPDGSSHSYYSIATDGEYKLNLNGSQLNLITKTAETAGGMTEYVPENYSPVRVLRCRVGTGCDGFGLPITNTVPNAVTPWTERRDLPYFANGQYCETSPLITETSTIPAQQHYWMVLTPDGNRWAFGTDKTSTKYLRLKNDFSGAATDSAYQSWYLTKVYSVLRDDPAAGRLSMSYTYTEEVEGSDTGAAPGHNICVARGAAWENNTRVTSIKYGNSLNSANPLMYEVEVTTTVVYSGVQGLNYIDVKADGKRLRRYQLTRGGLPWAPQLVSVQEQAWSNVTSSGAPDTALPAASFVYNEAGHSATYYHMTRLRNGYGGETEFFYFDFNNGNRYSHIQSTSDGMGNLRVRTLTGNAPCYDTTTSSCFHNHAGVFTTTGQSLMGFGNVSETIRTGTFNGPVVAASHTVYDLDFKGLGNALESRRYDLANQTNVWANPVLAASATEYALQTGAAFGQFASVYRKLPVKTYEYPLGDITASTNAVIKRVETDYDSYNNPVAIRELGWVNNTGDERTTFKGYKNDTSAWIIGKPITENTHLGQVAVDTSCAASLHSETKVFYDGNASETGPLSKGQVSKVQQGKACAGPGNTPPVNTTYQYVSSGNAASQLWKITDANGNPPSEVFYDNTGLFVTSTKDPLGFETAYFYNGINTTLITTQPWGALTSVRDANNVSVNYRYDPFGRIVRAFKPGDTELFPTMLWIYQDIYATGVFTGVRITESQFEIAGTNANQPRISIFNGLGEEVQTRIESQEATQLRVVSKRYDTLGRPVEQSAPIFETHPPPAGEPYFGYNAPNWNTITKTVTAYDALGRVTTVTSPGGEVMTHTYAVDDNTTLGYATTKLMLHGVENANRQLNQDLSDGLGRMRLRREFTGNCLSGSPGCATPWAKYAETLYGYDSADNLKTVTDALGRNTVITYNALNRKVAMTDPDMGAWAYAYDNNGNLLTQTDANPATPDLSFQYDALNRVTVRSAGAQTLATFAYDVGGAAAFANGRRTQAVGYRDGLPYVTRAYLYDARGRVTNDSVSMPGTLNQTLVTTYTYDTADRIVTLQYPPDEFGVGETVTYGYDAGMLPQSLSTNLGGSIVSGASYNEAGQARRMDYGNTLSRYSAYFGFDTPGVKTNFGALKQTCIGPASTSCLGAGSAGALKIELGYDKIGNITQWQDQTPAHETTINYGYDALNRLTSATTASIAPGDAAFAINETYGYDLVGNLTNKAGVTQFYTDTLHIHAITSRGTNGDQGRYAY